MQARESRSVSVINAEVAAAPIPMRIWRASKQCEDITLEESRTACEPILALYKERGAAARKAELEPRLIEAKAQRDRMEPPKAADPQAEALARLSGFPPDVVAYLMVAIIGLAVELTACLGIWVLIASRVCPTGYGAKW